MTVMQRTIPAIPATEDLDAIAMLEADHAEVDGLLKQFESVRATATAADKDAVVAEICFLITMHSTIEEEIFYPAVREALAGDAGDLLDEAAVEHASVKSLIAQLAEMTVDDDLYDAKVLVLGEYLRHHIVEEDTQLFPRVRGSALDLDELASRMRSRQQTFETDVDPGASS
jgi:hemerythrin-like domain-containing protein